MILEIINDQKIMHTISKITGSLVQKYFEKVIIPRIIIPIHTGMIHRPLKLTEREKQNITNPISKALKVYIKKVLIVWAILSSN